MAFSLSLCRADIAKMPFRAAVPVYAAATAVPVPRRSRALICMLIPRSSDGFC